MIINVRGTHGSGKSTLVRKVMEMYRKREPITMKGRKSPIGYVCRDRVAPHLSKHVVFVLGHYETPTGGCDTIPKVALMFKKIRKYADLGYDVLYEGILAQHSTPNIVALQRDDYTVRIVVLDVPIKKAIRAVKKRRWARGNTRPFNPQNVTKEAGSVRSTTERLRRAGFKINVYQSRARALRRVLTLLGVQR